MVALGELSNRVCPQSWFRDADQSPNPHPLNHEVCPHSRVKGLSPTGISNNTGSPTVQPVHRSNRGLSLTAKQTLGIPQQRVCPQLEVTGADRSANPQNPQPWGLSLSGISDGLPDPAQPENRKPSTYDRKTRRRIRTMKMSPKLLMVSLGELSNRVCPQSWFRDADQSPNPHPLDHEVCSHPRAAQGLSPTGISNKKGVQPVQHSNRVCP